MSDPAPAQPYLVLSRATLFSLGAEDFRESNTGATTVGWDRLFHGFACDAHVTQYHAPGVIVARLAGYSMHYIEGGLAGVNGVLVGLDIDNPEHAPWGPAAACEDGWDHLIDCIEEMRHEPSAAYLTRGGARLLWRLAEPVTLERMLGLQQHLAAMVAATGLTPDPRCIGQWGRIFRLPYVRRDGIDTRTQPYGDPEFCYADGQPLDASMIAEVPLHITMGKAIGARPLEPLPDAVTARALVFRDPADPEQGLTKLGTLIRKRAYAACAGVFLDDTSVASERRVFAQRLGVAKPFTHGRNEAIMRCASWLSSVLVRSRADDVGASPEALWGLLEPALWATDDQTLPPEPTDRGASSWAEFAWHWIQQRWEGDLEEREQQDAEVERVTEVAKIHAQQNLQGLAQRIMHEWPIVPEEIHEDPVGWMAAHAIACDGKGNSGYILNTKTLGYEHRHWQTIALASQLREMGWGTLIATTTLSSTGAEVDLPTPVLIQRHAATMTNERALYCRVPMSYLNGTTLVSATAYLNPHLRAEFSPDVDQFLDELVTPEHSPALKYYLSKVPAVDQVKLCTLILQGSTGAGKTMLALGIASVFHSKGYLLTPYSLQDIGNSNNGAMASSPVLVLDETSKESMSPLKRAAMFERVKVLVSGGAIQVKELYKDAYMVAMNYRTVMLSNDLNTARATLTGGSRATSQDIVESHARRTMAFHTPLPARPLRPARTKGWVDDLIIANHIMWLAEQSQAYWESQGIDAASAYDDVVCLPTEEVQKVVAAITELEDGDVDDGTPKLRTSNLWSTAMDSDLEALIQAMEDVARQTQGATRKIRVAAPGITAARYSLYIQIRPIFEAMAKRGVDRAIVSRLRALDSVFYGLRRTCVPQAYTLTDGTLTPVMNVCEVLHLPRLRRAADDMGGCETLVAMLDEITRLNG